MAQPQSAPLFFSCQAVRRFILENLAVGRRGGAERALVTNSAERALVGSAERAQCRAGTSSKRAERARAEQALVSRCAERARAELALN